MNLIDIAVLSAVAAIVAGIVVYICRAKKKGVKCIGCPDSAGCSGNCAGCSCCTAQDK